MRRENEGFTKDLNVKIEFIQLPIVSSIDTNMNKWKFWAIYGTGNSRNADRNKLKNLSFMYLVNKSIVVANNFYICNTPLIEEFLNTICVCFIQPMEPIKCLLLSPSLCLSKLLSFKVTNIPINHPWSGRSSNIVLPSASPAPYWHIGWSYNWFWRKKLTKKWQIIITSPQEQNIS